MKDNWTMMQDFMVKNKVPADLIKFFADSSIKFRNQLGAVAQKTLPPSMMIFEMLNGIVINKLLGIMAQLKIADLLVEGPKSSGQLAEMTGTNASALDRMLKTLVAFGILDQPRNGVYQNNGISEYIREDHPNSVRDGIIMVSSDWYWDIWNQAMHSIVTGEDTTSKVKGNHFFDFLAADEAAGKTFHNGMAVFSNLSGPYITKDYDFSTANTICDVGGSNGLLLANLLLKNPGVKGVLFDRPEVAERADYLKTIAGLEGRVEIIPGSFFEEVPGGYDLYLVSSILHDWSDEDCITILKNIRKAMDPNGKVLVMDQVLPEGDDYNPVRILDIHMLVITKDAKERTKREFKLLFMKAGFTLSRYIPFPTADSMMELTPIGENGK